MKKIRKIEIFLENGFDKKVKLFHRQRVEYL